MFNNFFFRKSCRLWDIVEKYGTVGQATDGNTLWCMRFAWWVTNATDTHTQYVILIVCYPIASPYHSMCTSPVFLQPIAFRTSLCGSSSWERYWTVPHWQTSWQRCCWNFHFERCDCRWASDFWHFQGPWCLRQAVLVLLGHGRWTMGIAHPLTGRHVPQDTNVVFVDTISYMKTSCNLLVS